MKEAPHATKNPLMRRAMSTLVQVNSLFPTSGTAMSETAPPFFTPADIWIAPVAGGWWGLWS